MERKDFGQLVATLRQDLGWTQFKLAEVAEIDEPVISQIERGVKRFLDPDLLFKLANALQLTTLERREFVLAASGLDEQKIVRQASASVKTDVFDFKKILERMVGLVETIRLPAFLTDVYGDVLAANLTMLAFYAVPKTMIESGAHMPGGYNIVRANFGRELIVRDRFVDGWDSYAIGSMRAFRVNSLRYRAKPYFKYLIKAFRNPLEFPLFERFWNLVSSTEQDKETNVDHFTYNHPEYGALSYLATSTIAITSYGELFLVHNIPLDEQTEQVFAKINQSVGPGVIRLAPWPQKSMS